MPGGDTSFPSATGVVTPGLFHVPHTAKDLVHRAVGEAKTAVAERDRARREAQDMKFQLDTFWAMGHPEREASLKSVITAMTDMNHVLSNRCRLLNTEVRCSTQCGGWTDLTPCRLASDPFLAHASRGVAGHH